MYYRYILFLGIGTSGKKTIGLRNTEKNESANLFSSPTSILPFQYDLSNCPDEAWYLNMAMIEEYFDKEFTFINNGFNKGYNFAVWLSLFTSSGVSSSIWHDHLQNWRIINGLKSDRTDCGVCNDCKFKYTVSKTKNYRIKIVGVDLNKQNIDLVSGVFSTLNHSGQLKDVSVQLLLEVGILVLFIFQNVQ